VNINGKWKRGECLPIRHQNFLQCYIHSVDGTVTKHWSVVLLSHSATTML